MKNDLTTPDYWDQVYRASEKRRSRRGWLPNLVRRARTRSFLAFLGKAIDQIGKRNGDLLELGCAPGRRLEQMHAARPQHRLHGIEYVQHAAATTRQRLSESGIDATVYHGDICTIELPRKYDLVMSFGLIEHFDDPVPILRHHVRLCERGGYVVVTVPNYSTPFVRILAHQFDPKHFAIHHLEIMKPSAIKMALEKVGLEDVQAGGFGGPRIRCVGTPEAWYGQWYGRFAWGWNLIADLLPLNPLWHSTYWGIGRVRVEEGSWN